MTEQERIIITKYDLLYEQRMTRVETVLESINRNMQNIEQNMNKNIARIDRDLRWLLGITLGGFGSILIVMAHGFQWF